MTLRRRLTRSTALIALAAVLVLGIPLGLVEAARLRSDETGKLEREADVVAGRVDDRLQRGELPSGAELARLVPAGHRVAITANGRSVTAGARLGDDVVSARAGTPGPGVIVASAPAAEINARLRRSWGLIAILGVGGIGMAAALAAVQARRLSRPLERVALTSARLGDGDFSARAPRCGVPEIDAIGRAVDTSAGRIAELVAREREFSSNISHQLRTPLTALQLRLDEAARTGDPEVVREELGAALREADRLEAMIADLLAHARSSARREMVTVPLAATARQHAALWTPLLTRAGRRVELDVQVPRAAALASRGTVGQVLDVLLDNSLRHGAGRVCITVGEDDRFAFVTVQDEGDGVPEAVTDAVFDRGATHADGTGIGLHLARTLARADGGSLRLTRARPPCFELRLRPAADDHGP